MTDVTCSTSVPPLAMWQPGPIDGPSSLVARLDAITLAEIAVSDDGFYMVASITVEEAGGLPACSREVFRTACLYTRAGAGGVITAAWQAIVDDEGQSKKGFPVR